MGSSDRGAAVAPWASAWVRPPAKTKPTVSAPPLRTARRVNRCGMIGAVISASLSRSGHHGAHDPHMGSTSTEIALKRRANIIRSGLRFFRQQRSSTDNHSSGAVSALRHLLFDECGLYRMRRRYCSKPFKSDDRFTLCVRNRFQAGWRWTAVDEHVAGAALAKATTELRGSEAEAAQPVEQRLVGIRQTR